MLKRSCLLFVIVLLWIIEGASSAGADEGFGPINYRLKWLFNASVVGDLYADVHGLFEKTGLDVCVKEGGPERDAIRELELGYAQFGVASGDQVIRALSKGAPVVVIAQLFQINPMQWIYRTENVTIRRIEDLEGKVVGITYGGNDETIMRTLLAKGDIHDSEVEFFSVRYDYLPFYKGKVDLWPVYRNSQGITIAEKLRDAGEKTGYFDPSEFGVRFVANSIVTSEDMLKDHPVIVEKFIYALVSAWEASLSPENKEKSLKMIGKYDRDTPPELIEAQLDATRRLVKPFIHTKIGAIDTAAWKQTEKIMLNQQLISKPVRVEKAFREYIK